MVVVVVRGGGGGLLNGGECYQHSKEAIFLWGSSQQYSTIANASALQAADSAVA
jgi:hypothetical protein